jgi:hypothetical protein
MRMRSEGWLFAMPEDKAAAVAAKRGQMVSALMKNIRLRREVDACYWFLLLFRGGIDRPYLGRRCYGSSAEDGMSIPAMEMGAELVTQPATTELPYLQSVIASSRAPKWYEAPYRQYTLDRLAVFDGGRPWCRETDATVLRWGEEGLDQHEFVKMFRADLELWYRKKNLPLERKIGRAGEQSDLPEVKRLAACLLAHLWFHATRDTFVPWQMGWQMFHGPLPGVTAPIDLSGSAATIAVARERWNAAALEAVPAWCLDGIHTSGTDARFAGDPGGVRNMLAMYDRYGRLDPSDEGLLRKAGAGGTHRKGMWPVVVPSRNAPGQTYTIDSDGWELFCSCPSFRWRSRLHAGSCKHLTAFLAEHPGLDRRAPAD